MHFPPPGYRIVIMAKIEFKNRLGRRIHYFRSDIGLSLQQLAKEIGSSVSSLSAIESGDRLPGLELLVKLADYFRLGIDQLIGREVPQDRFMRSIRAIKELAASENQPVLRSMPSEDEMFASLSNSFQELLDLIPGKLKLDKAVLKKFFTKYSVRIIKRMAQLPPEVTAKMSLMIEALINIEEYELSQSKKASTKPNDGQSNEC